MQKSHKIHIFAIIKCPILQQMSPINNCTRVYFQKILNEHLLILDGAMGTMLQNGDFTIDDFGGHKGNNDFLNITRPEEIQRIHKLYIEAGADIIETNTFNSTLISQTEYGTGEYVHQMNFEGAKIAKRVAGSYPERTIFVAGSIGPTIRSLSLASDMTRPEYREVSFTQMQEAYYEQAKSLLEGGVDLFLIETVYDSINAKAALYAIAKLQEEQSTDLPVMVSVTINDRGGRLLNGQRWDAFIDSIAHYPIASFGFNCSFGAEDLTPFIDDLNRFEYNGCKIPCGISLYPNAGLPNELGEYTQSPNFMGTCIASLSNKINIAGGCCGTTPEHIRAIKNAAKEMAPRQFIYPEQGATNLFGKGISLKENATIVSGLEPLEINKEKNNFINIGERTNVAGSAKFARLIREGKYSDAAEIAKKQIEDGATIIDINTDDPMLNGSREMETFLRYLNSDPSISRVPYMIDSSDWETVITALQNCIGKAIVNSISLKEGEENFKAKAKEIHRLGAAVIVMAFDEHGQATTFERKIEICKRAYHILTDDIGYLPQDIIFDVNVLSVATGLEEHNNYAVNFIEAVRWIKHNLPGCKTSGGISNLSFSFRGNNKVREAMHSVFLYHAIDAGLDMAIVNPSMLQIYDRIEPELLKLTEAVILNISNNASEHLIKYALSVKEIKESVTEKAKIRQDTIEERLTQSLINGETAFLQEDLAQALIKYSKPVEIIEGPLMDGMQQVGKLFGEGKMFLPQVVKSAKVMKCAVDILQPQIEKDKGGVEQRHKYKIVVATVKGDIHDIGKNIAAIVLGCNNFDIIDLGVMIDNDTIINEALHNKADIIGVSGLITPSLKQMEDLCCEMEQHRNQFKKEIGHEVPLIVGGAATSQLHTSVKLAPLYGYSVIYGSDASQTAIIAKGLTTDRNGKINDLYIAEIKNEQRKIADLYNSAKEKNNISLEEARRMAVKFQKSSFKQPDGYGEHNLKVINLDINELVPYMDWTIFFNFWGIKGVYPNLLYEDNNEEAEKLYVQAIDTIAHIAEDFDAGALMNFYDACSYNEDIYLLKSLSEEEVITPPATRQIIGTLSTNRQLRRGTRYLSAADYFPSLPAKPESNSIFCDDTSVAGLFIARILDRKEKEYDHKSYDYMLRFSIRAALTEGLADWLQHKVDLGFNCVRAAFGYPMCLNHSLKRTTVDLLHAQEILGIRLTESNSIIPETSVCGLLIAHQDAKYLD